MEVEFPVPVAQETVPAESGEKFLYFSMAGLQNVAETGYPYVPFLSDVIALQGRQATVKILEIRKDTQTGLPYRFNISERNTPIRKTPLIDVQYLGLYRDLPLFTLKIYPVQVDPVSGAVEVVNQIRFEIFSTDHKKTESTQPTATSSVRLPSTTSKILLNSAMVLPETQSLSKIEMNISGQRYQSDRYKINIKETGLYKITYELLAQYDIPVDQFDPRRLKLTNRGQEIPIYFKGGGDGTFDTGDYFEFWGEQNRSDLTRKYEDIYNDPFSDVNVYWLEIGSTNGLRMVDESGALTISNPSRYITPYAYTEKIHFEEDRVFVRFGHPTAKIDSAGYTLDHWFFDRGVSAVGSRTYQAYLPWPFGGFGSATVFVKALMRGLSEKSPVNPLEFHLAEVWLNDAKVGTSGNWRDQGLQTITNIGGLGISQSAIKHGENDLRIIMDQAGVTDIALLNWFEITYQRRYRAENNVIRFKRQENIPEGYTYQFEVDGFTRQDIELYKLGISKLVNNRIDYITADDDNYTSYRISFQDDIFYPDIEYVALTSDAKKKPVSIVPDTPWRDDVINASLYDHTNASDYLIVTDALFADAALELKAYREQNGLRVGIVKVEDIYDEFNYGIKSPISIQDFLKYVYQNWDQSRKLMYVVLIGNASFDYKQVSSSQRDLVPTFLFETQKYGSAASDFLYSLVSGDDYIPDIVVSRIPVNDNSELTAYFEKIKGYEAPDNTGDWRNRALFISGNDGSVNELFTGLPVFRAQNQRLIDMLLPEAYFSRKLNTIRDAGSGGVDPNFGGTIDLIDQFDDGLSLMNFYGHGGGGIWADVQLMNTDDIDRLSEHYRLPFIQSMTCFTGAFENASINGLADKLLLTPRKGAIGLLAASGVGWLYNDFAVGWHLTEMLMNYDLTMGEAVLFSKIFYYANNIYVSDEYDTAVPSLNSLRKSMVNHYNLLGDPYIKIARPQGALKVSIENTQLNQGDTITVSISAPFSNGSGVIELANQKHEPVENNFFSLTNSTANVSFTLPQDLGDQRLFIKAYAAASGGTQDANGSLDLAINSTLIDSVVTVPKLPLIGEDINFFVYINSPLEIERVQITHLKGNLGTIYTLDLVEQAEGVWKSKDGFGPYTHADTVHFDVQVFEAGGTSHLLRRVRMLIGDPRPDLRLTGNSLVFGGESDIALAYKIENRASETFSDVKISYFTDTYPTDNPAYDSSLISLEPGEIKYLEQVVAPAYLQPARRFFVVVDHDKAITEQDETNNVQMLSFPDGLFNIPREIGSTLDGISNDTLRLAEIIGLHIASQGITASSVLKIDLRDRPDLVKIETQPGLIHVPFFDQTGHQLIEIDLSNPNSTLDNPFYVEFNIDTTKYSPEYITDIHICHYVAKLNRWVRLETSRKAVKIYAQPEDTGLFALFHISDAQKPVIEITVNGRQLHENMLVPSNPDLAFILQDENGINLSRGLNILVDNDSLPSDVVNMPDSLQNANAVSILSTPNLSAGQHTLSVSVQDVNGNQATKTINFAVASTFGIEVYGNYPNPFTDDTIISFEIVADGVVQEFSVRIYTVSGRMIREIKRNEEYPDEIWTPGYHEVKWDGRDKDLNLVANGVYFAVIAAKFKGTTMEQTLKLAKLK